MVMVWLISITPPVAAGLDLTPFASVIAALLGGGVVHAVSQYKKTPAEVESISVATLSNALERLRIEMRYKDDTIDDCTKTNAELRARIIALEKQLGIRKEPDNGK